MEFAGALYHVTARGDRQEPIFEDDQDRRAYCEGGYTQTAIARALDLSVSRISRVIRAGEAKGKT